MIVNADDYGHSAGVSAGIRYSHLHGLVTSTTAMLNMPGVEADIHAAMLDCPRLGLGVHLVLTTGVPVLPSLQIKSLVTGDGSFARSNASPDRLSRLDPQEVKAEWSAQIEKFVSITGRPPDHLDSHHHVSFLSPHLFKVMLDLAQRYDCAIRFPTGESASEILAEFPAGSARACWESNLYLVNQYQPSHPDKFVSSFYDEGASQMALLNLLGNLPEGTTEVMCHPGYADAGLVGRSVYLKQRQAEVSILTAPEVIGFVKTREIELINFGDL